jgi:hypothetical protein
MAAIKLVYTTGASLTYRGRFAPVEILQAVSAAPNGSLTVNTNGIEGLEDVVILSCRDLMAAFEVPDDAAAPRGIQTSHVAAAPVVVENHVLAPLRRTEGLVERDEAGRVLRTVQVESFRDGQ